MPKINTKLATSTLRQTGGGGQVSSVPVSPRGGMISSGAGQISARVSPPQLKVGAGNVQYTKLQPNDIVVNKGLDAMGEFAQVWAESAFRFQQRQDEADAKAMVMAYREQLSKGEIGYTDEDGKPVKGFLYRELQDAVDNFEPHTRRVDEMYNELIMSAPENVRQLALVSMARERNAALERAATHKAQQFAGVEEQQKYLDRKQQLSLAREYGPSYFTDGRFESHLNEYGDDIEARDAAAGYIVEQSMYQAYNEQLANPKAKLDDPYLAAKEVFDSASPFLENTEEYNKAQHRLLRWKEEIDRIRKAEKADKLKEAQDQSERDTPVLVAQMIANNGDPLTMLNTVERHADMFPDDTSVEREDRIAKVITGSIDLLIDDPRYEDIPPVAKAEIISGAAIEIMTMIGTKLPNAAVQQINDYIEDDLPQKVMERQNSKDAIEINKMVARLAQYEGKGVPEFVPPPNDMTPQNKERWRKFQATHARQYVYGLTDDEIEAQKRGDVHWRGKQIIEPLTDQELDLILQDVIDGRLSMSSYLKALVENRRLRGVNRDTPAWKKQPSYKSGLTQLKKDGKKGYFTGDLGKEGEVPDEESDEYLPYVTKNEMATSEAAVDFQQYAYRQWEAKQPVIYQEWLVDYLKRRHDSIIKLEEKQAVFEEEQAAARRAAEQRIREAEARKRNEQGGGARQEKVKEDLQGFVDWFNNLPKAATTSRKARRTKPKRSYTFEEAFNEYMAGLGEEIKAGITAEDKERMRLVWTEMRNN